MRTCCDCGSAKPVTEFYTHRKSGYASDCKDCSRTKSRERLRIKRLDPDFRQRERDEAAVFRETNRDLVLEWARRHARTIGRMDRTPDMPEFDLTKRVTYVTAHKRVQRWRGRADIHPCIRCEAPANTWAYRHDSSHEQIGTTNSNGKRLQVRFSPDPMDYVPMCWSCHTLFDRMLVGER